MSNLPKPRTLSEVRNRCIERNGCWEWPSPKLRQYGAVYHEGKVVKATRYVWLLTTGQVPPASQYVCHTCDNPPCVNPDHLFLGTHLQNQQDKLNKGRQMRGSAHHLTKLSEVDVQLIRYLSQCGVSGKRLSALYSTSAPSISEILTRKTWRHVPDLEYT